MRHHRTARGGETDGAALVASRVASFTRARRRAGTFQALKFRQKKNRSADADLASSQKLRIDAARKKRLKRFASSESRAEDIIIFIFTR